MKEKFVGVTEARTMLRELLEELDDHDIVILRRNRPVARIIHPARLDGLIEKIEDLEDENAALENRLSRKPGAPHSEVEASLDSRRRLAKV